MGALLLCNRPIAAMPYYIEALSLNIYSLEELCYVIEQHPILMDEGFFEDELLFWIEHEIGEGVLAEALRQSLRDGAGITRLVEQVLNATGYLPYEIALTTVRQIREMQHKSVFERRKMRADRYVENKKYKNALSEYRRILQMEEECRKNPVVCGNIWHNMGTVYARLFLFEAARECFERAYQYNANLESIYEAMATCIYFEDHVEWRHLAKKYGIDAADAAELSEKYARMKQTEEVLEAESKIEELFQNEPGLTQEQAMEENVALKQVLQTWKQEYQKNCR